MNLISCPDCGKAVSRRAKACPHCGCPSENFNEASTRDEVPVALRPSSSLMISDVFAKYCDATLELKTACLTDAYYYFSLPLCVIDAIFSIGVKYAGTRNVVLRYADHYNLKTFRTVGAPYPPAKEQHTISQLVSNFDVHGIESMASNVFRNKQRTSAKNGILKSEAVYAWAKILQLHHIETFHDFGDEFETVIEDELKSVPGQKSGISLGYLYMLAGNDDYCKPDRHIRNYIEQATGKLPSIEDTRKIVRNAVCELRVAYPHLTDRLLDYVIWEYMSRQA